MKSKDKEKKLVGEILLDLGYITYNDLQEVLDMQIKELNLDSYDI